MNPLPQADRSNLGVMLQSLTERAQVLTRGEAAAIALADRGAMICRASVGRNAPALGCQLDVSTGFSGACFRSRKALRCEDIDNDSRVDAEICRRLGIRSILAAPIWVQGEIVGLLEVFSSQRFAFHDGDLAVVQKLAESALTPSVPKPVPAPKLLIEMEPAWHVFWENLTDLLCPPRMTPLKLTSRPARFWSDVFVPAQLPWQRFGHSILLHGTLLVILLALLKFGISQPRLVAKSSFSQSDVIYYAPSEYMPNMSERAHASAARSATRQVSVEQSAIPVRRGSSHAAHEQATVAPPTLSLKSGIRLLRFIGGSTVLPAAPISADMPTERATRTLGIAAIAPPPQIAGLSRSRMQISGAGPNVVPPAPAISQLVHQPGTISIGQLQVVAPAPDVPLPQHGLTLSAMRSTLGGRETAVVAPAPSVNGAGRSGVGGFQGAVHMQVVPPAPTVQMAKSFARGVPGGAAIAVVPPPPSVGGLGRSGSYGGSRVASSPQVVPPAPAVQIARSYAGGVLGGGTADVVPPAPSVAGLGRAGGARGNSPSGSSQVVPPAPAVQLARSYGGGALGGGTANVVPPSPSVAGLGRAGGGRGGSLSGSGIQVVPPAPSVHGTRGYGSGTNTTIAFSAVPPAPTTNALGSSGGHRGTNSVGTLETRIAAPAHAAQSGSDKTGPVTLAGMRPGGLLPGEIVAETTQAFAAVKQIADPKFPETKELNVDFVGPALVLPATSYFLSYEVFIAEEWLARHKSRLIKLVYDFLPYQPRLSDYGPNFPAIENLRATRDPSCDENLSEVESSTNAWPKDDRAQLNAKSADHKQSRLPCYRTTADDYRKARTRQGNPNRDR